MKLKEDLVKIDLTFRKTNTESIEFTKNMGDVHYQNKVKSIIYNLEDVGKRKKLLSFFDPSSNYGRWLEFYDHLHKFTN